MKDTANTCVNEIPHHEGMNYMGALPERTDTVMADIIARLLDGGKPLTAMEAMHVYGRSIGLSKMIDTLEEKYGWDFDRTIQKERTRDGRYIWTIGYQLAQAAIDYARVLNHFAWTDIVKMSRYDLEKPALSKPMQVQSAVKGNK